MSENQPTWQEVRRLADELQLQIHLAGMDARDTWHALQPRVVALEHALEKSGEDAVKHELAEVRTALRKLRDDLSAHTRGNYVRGW